MAVLSHYIAAGRKGGKNAGFSPVGGAAGFVSVSLFSRGIPLRTSNGLAPLLFDGRVKFRWPDARLFTETIAPRFKEPHPGWVLMVGDTESDLLFAKNAGLRVCWASYGYGDGAACNALAPEFILPVITQLPSLIHTICSSE